MKINLEKLNFKIALLFPLTTLFQTIFPPLNKIFFVLLLITFIPIYLNKITIKRFTIGIVTILLIIYDYFITEGTLYNLNELFYLPFCILFFIYISENFQKYKEFLISEKNYILGIVYIWTTLVFISIFFSSSWVIDWGGAKYFGSFCRSVWRLTPTAVYIGTCSIALMIYYKNKNYIYFLFMPLFCFFMSGSRTYMVVGILLFLISWYYYVNTKTHFLLSIIPVCFILFILILNSSMMSKFDVVLDSKNSYFDPLGTLTSGRSIFWEADIEAFIKENFIKKFFGNGFNFIYDINYKAFDGLVWAHNDFIQCLVSHGILGLFLYLSSIILAIKSITKGRKYILPFVFVILIWLFNAFFNMFYTYFCSMLSYPILLLAVKDGERKFDYKKKGIYEDGSTMCKDSLFYKKFKN